MVNWSYINTINKKDKIKYETTKESNQYILSYYVKFSYGRFYILEVSNQHYFPRFGSNLAVTQCHRVAVIQDH